MARKKKTLETPKVPRTEPKKSFIKTRRNQSKLQALDPHLNLKNRQDLIDYDYVNKLSEKDKKWLNKFTEEYTNDVLDRKNLDNNLHNTPELKKDCDTRNNARNRCVLTKQKSMGRLEYIEELIETTQSPEDALNDKIDEDLNS